MNRTLIIAEAGVNHNGDIDLAKKLIREAAKAGADIVKFQSFKASKLVSPLAKKANYQKINTGNKDDSQFNMLKSLELTNEDHLTLVEECESNNIKFLSTAFDNEGLEFLNNLNLGFFKVPSGEITNLPYLKKLSTFGKPVVLSTGMSNMKEIKAAVDILSKNLAIDMISILHCNTEYPTPMEDVNLTAMVSIKNEMECSVGYSDHTVGIEIPIAAVALGATIIEKHFTLDRTLPGPDHAASLEPEELSNMVKAIRNIELALNGDGIKRATPSELKNIPIARKSIHAVKSISKNQIITSEDLIALRPGDGISPMKWDEIIGRKAALDIPKFKKLDFQDLL